METIVVIRPGALGDVILTLPAVQALRRQHRDARITVAGSPSLWELAGDLIDSRVSIDAARFSTLYAAEPGDELRRWLEGVDKVIAWTVRDPSIALRKAGVRDILHVSPYPPVSVHVSAWLAGSVDPHPPNPLLPGVGEGGTDVATGSPPLRSNGRGDRGARVFLHPGAGATWKRWPAERFAVVGDHLRAQGYEVILIEGPADREAIERVQAATGAPFPVLRDRSLPELAGALRRAALFIGNDSGVTHLAAAAGAPTIAIFGPTDPATWAPLGRVQVLRHCHARATEPRWIRVCEGDCLLRISVKEVLDAAASQLDVDNSVDKADEDALKGVR